MAGQPIQSLRSSTQKGIGSRSDKNFTFRTKAWAYTGFKHLSSRESQAITFYRFRMHMSLNHIAQIVERSARTVWNIVSKNTYRYAVEHSYLRKFDNRRWCLAGKIARESWFRRAYGVLTWFYELWKEGIISNISLLTGKTAKGEPP